MLRNVYNIYNLILIGIYRYYMLKIINWNSVSFIKYIYIYRYV